MTKDEYILQRLKDERSMYRMLFIICVIAAIGSVGLAIAAIVIKGSITGIAVFGGMALFFVSYALTSKSANESYSKALDEIGDATEGVADNHNYSQATATVIAKSWLDAKKLFGALIAYGICGLMCVAGSIVIFLIPDEEIIFPILGAVLLAMGLFLLVLAMQSFRSWRAAKQLDL